MSPDAPATSITITFEQAFTFLFLTLGPLKILGPFAAMTRGYDRAFKRRLALEATVIAAIGAVAAATVGVALLRKWGVSVEALLLTAGVVLFLIALKPILEQYAPREARPEPPAQGTAPPPRTSALAFSPLAFPTIITPYGVAVLVLLVALSGGRMPQVLAVAGVVLALDLLAMIAADRILANPYVSAVLGILGTVIGVLQVALGVQLATRGMKLLGVVGGAGG